MILKYQHEGTESFIDNIIGFTIIEKDSEYETKKATVSIEKKVWGGEEEIFNLTLTEKAYLMNDNGKTIERLI
jgi:alanine dehydrogenase